jgi:hypothetical protein
MDAITVTQMTPTEFQSLIENSVKNALSSQIQKSSIDPLQRLTRKQVKERYNISYPTIHSKINSGELESNTVGRKRLIPAISAEKCFGNSNN